MRLREKGEKALITYLTFNFPEPKKFRRFLHAVIEGGCDIIEIGVPFSDPIADGRMIQDASQRALSFGTSLEKIMGFLERERRNLPIPVVLMGYINPFIQFGIENLSKNAFVDGFIIPDLSYEESIKLGIHKRLPLIQLIAPTTPLERAKKIAKISYGFVYYISVTGTTGSEIKDVEGIKKFVQEFKNECKDLPTVVGFGIRSAEDVRKLSFADGVVIGSALLKMLAEEETDFKRAKEFVRSLKRATR